MTPNGITSALKAAIAKLGGQPPGAVAECPAKVMDHGGPPPRKNPCSGIGMSDAASQKQYVAEFKKVQADWSKLSVAQREARLQGIVNDPLTKSGAPGAIVESSPLPGGKNGEFDFKTWTLRVNQDLVKSNQLSDEDAKKLSGVVYHEARHSEQWYLMASKRAGEGATADDISKELGLSPAEAEYAVNHPMADDDPRKACADALYDSVYGKNRAHRNKTLTDLSRLSKANKDAATRFRKLQADPKATQQQKQEALDQWKQTYAGYKKVYADYRNLPEESDAWSAGDGVEGMWGGAQKKGPVVKTPALP